MNGSGPGDRRFRARTPSLTRECRLCWRNVILEPQHVEVTDTHVYVRCPNCGGSFPIRHSDAEVMLGHEASAS